VFPGIPLLITALNREVQGGDPVNLSGYPIIGCAQQNFSESPVIFL
tara:strand:- start:1085 stop:1222 length:138 start_codon:yes stop_codon:yes gene_type:complete